MSANVYIRLKQCYQTLFVLFTLALLTACGGGSSGGDTTPTIGASVQLAISNADGQAVTSATIGDTLTLTGTARDDFGNRESGITLTFTAGGGTLSQATAITNGNGQATVTLNTADMTAGVVSISVAGTVDGRDLTQSRSIEIQNAPAPIEPTLTIEVYDETCSVIRTTQSSGTAYCVEAQLLDQGSAVADQIVTFTANVGNVRQASVLTNASGIARTYIDSDATTSGAGQVQATYDQISVSKNYQFTSTTSEITLAVTDSDGEAVTTAAIGDALTLTGTAKDGFGNLRSGITLTFTASGGTLSQGSAITNSSGTASVTLNTTGMTAGVATMTVAGIIDGSSLNQSRDVELQTAPPPLEPTIALEIYDATCTVPTTTQTAGNTYCVEALLLDQGTPAAEQIIVFSAEVGNLRQPSVLTGSTGIARTFIDSDATNIGAGQIQATFDQVTASKNYQFTAPQTDVIESTLTIRDQDCSIITNQAETGTPLCLHVQLTLNGLPYTNQLINFAAPLGTLRQGAALTSTQGIATALLDSPDGILGAATASATFGNITSNANYEFIAATSPAEPQPTITLGMSQNGQTTNRFKAGTTVTIEATALEEDGTPMPNQIVNFTAEVGSLSPLAALTDVNGVAATSLTSTTEQLGAGVATATFTHSQGNITNTLNYQVLAADATEEQVKVGYFDENNNFIEGAIGTTGNVVVNDANQPVISAGGTLGLNVTIVDQDNERITTPIQVGFTSTCVTDESATIEAQSTTINGTASATFQDTSCATINGNTDTIVASITVNSNVINATRTIQLSPEALGSIEFVSAVPEQIVLKGTGGAGKQETSTLTFRVRSQEGNPVAQEKVTFALSTTVGGLTLSHDENLTNSEGLVTTRVISGTAPTAVRVTATVGEGDNVISSQSDLLSVNTGLPDQNSMTIATSSFNPEAHSISGQEVFITAWLADAFNNPVPDGTTVNFTTEGGTIQPTCNTTSGSCTVTWEAANPRVDNHRITILATAVGHETFFDTNGNNVFDEGTDGIAISDDTDSGLGRGDYYPSGFIDHSEAWRDDNEDGTRQSGETFVDFNADDQFSPADGQFNGSQRTCTSDACANAQNSINVRKSLIMIMSGSQAELSVMSPDGVSSQNNPSYIDGHYVIKTNDPDVTADGPLESDIDIELREGASIDLIVAYADNAQGPGQTLPAGTVVSASASIPAAALTGNTSLTVPNTIGTSNPNGYGGDYLNLIMTNNNQPGDENTGDITTVGTLDIAFTFPSSNLTQTFSVTIRMIGQ